MFKVEDVRNDYSRPMPAVSLGKAHGFHLGRLLPAVFCLGSMLVPAAFAQYAGKVNEKPKGPPPLRAIAVLEWTGQAGKPKASRIVPVAIFDGEQLNDASVYMSRPEPLAVSREVQYQLKEQGKTVGLFEVKTAGHEQGSWVGYGEWRPAEKPKLENAAAKPVIDSGSENDDKPVLHRKQHEGADAKVEEKAPEDPDRPKLHKPAGDESKTQDSQSQDAKNDPKQDADDPDHPTLHRHAEDGAKPTADDVKGSVDPDRPVMKKRTEKPRKAQEEGGTVENVARLSDPDRPRLQRGKSAAENLKVTPSLMGLPPEMEQMVAVSDAQNRPDHPWVFSWADPEDERKIKAQVEDVARAALGLTPAAQVPAAQTPAATKPAAKSPAQRRAARAAAKKAAEAAAVPAELNDEQFKVFELAYGSGATIVLTANTGGALKDEKFVTVIAQPDLYGNVQVLLKSVTDGSHLDETPRMRLVDAVDATEDNRAELLFELRGKTQREFAMYRVMRSRAEKIFSGAGGEYGSMDQ